MNNDQLNLIEKIEEIKIAEMPYRNSLGQILPFEHEDGFCDNCGTSLALDHICEDCRFVEAKGVSFE